MVLAQPGRSGCIPLPLMLFEHEQGEIDPVRELLRRTRMEEPRQETDVPMQDGDHVRMFVSSRSIQTVDHIDTSGMMITMRDAR